MFLSTLVGGLAYNIIFNANVAKKSIFISRQLNIDSAVCFRLAATGIKQVT